MYTSYKSKSNISNNLNLDNAIWLAKNKVKKGLPEEAEFIYNNKEDKSVKDLISYHFKYYFSEIISKYNSKNLYLSGSIAYFFEKDIRDVSHKFNINIIKVIRDPINHLVKFHVK